MIFGPTSRETVIFQMNIHSQTPLPLDANQVVILAGATGCGKTTQIPQLILDKQIQRRNFSCKLVCTQPRRIAATSVAKRVKQERCGDDSIGYHVKLDVSSPRPNSSVLYCTTGILLQTLCSRPNLETISHVILDEVHERDLDTDFMMAVSKLISSGKRKDLKVILMSATMHTEAFSK